MQVPGGVVVLGPGQLGWQGGQEELPLSYNKMQVFLSLKGFSEAGIPISKGSFLACSSQYSIRSAEALDTCSTRGGKISQKWVCSWKWDQNAEGEVLGDGIIALLV